MAYQKIFSSRPYRNAAAISHIPRSTGVIGLARQDAIGNTGIVNITKDSKTSTSQYIIAAATGFYNNQTIFDSSVQGFEGRELQISTNSADAMDNTFYVKINHDTSVALTPNTSGVINLYGQPSLLVYKTPINNVVIQGTGSASYQTNFTVIGNASEQFTYTR